MKRWIREWLRTWRDEQVVVSSPLSTEQARRRLDEGLSRDREYVRGALPSEFQVRGSVDFDYDEVRLWAMRPGQRNSWRPVLRGQLVPSGDGCELVGRLGSHPSTRALSVVWLGMAAFFGVVGLVVAVREALTGDVHDARGPALVSLGAFGFLAFFIGLTIVAGRWSRAETAHLRAWLKDSLESQR